VLLTALAGLGFGLSLIVAIGAQNAFVLRQGLRREHVLAVVLVCALSDAVLILLGIAGAGADWMTAPVVLTVVTAALTADGPAVRAGLVATVGTVLALTWLNPHVYLDTVVLLGSIANTHGDGRWWFGLGAVLGSVIWFTALGYGARLLQPVFAKPVAWRVLDAIIAVVMIALAASLVIGALGHE
jgi:L-lysine exporter family protein LysE/ArgO